MKHSGYQKEEYKDIYIFSHFLIFSFSHLAIWVLAEEVPILIWQGAGSVTH